MRSTNATNAPPLPWTNVYGLARTLIATSTMLTLLVNDPGIVWLPAAGLPQGLHCDAGGPVPNFFCLAPERLGLARWVAVAILAVVASGWRPRITGTLHWWVTYSFVSSSLLIDGGDQLSAGLTLLMLPITWTDPRRSHWDPMPPRSETHASNVRAGIATATSWALRLQVAIVYLNAAASKWGELEWADGTALYYWFSDPAFGFTPALQAVFGPLLLDGFVVSTMTWGVIAFEFALFGGLFARDVLPRSILLGLGIAFHTAIAFVHGLPSFVLIMFGALILLFRREYEPFSLRLPRMLDRRSQMAASAESPTPAQPLAARVAVGVLDLRSRG